jgi:hypothetical protein
MRLASTSKINEPTNTTIINWLLADDKLFFLYLKPYLIAAMSNKIVPIAIVTIVVLLSIFSPSS